MSRVAAYFAFVFVSLASAAPAWSQARIKTPEPARTGSSRPATDPNQPGIVPPRPSPTPVKTRGTTIARPKPAPTPEPVKPEPLPELPPPLAEQALPFSIRFIDRPYTMPKGLHEFSLRGSLVYAESLGGGVHFLEYLGDVQYRQPITNDFSLIWNPLPLGVRYQPKRTDNGVTGVSWALGWQYQGNIGFKPEFGSYLRYNFSRDHAIEMQLGYFTFIPIDEAPSLWGGSFRVGPLFQHGDRFAFSPRLALSIDNVQLERLYREDRTPIESPDVLSKSARVTFPVSLWFGWAVTPGFDVLFEYTVLGAGLRSGYYAQVGTLGINARW